MADNVIKFRKIEKKPEPKKPDPRALRPPGRPPKWPTWLPWAVIGMIGLGYFVLQSTGVLAG